MKINIKYLILLFCILTSTIMKVDGSQDISIEGISKEDARELKNMIDEFRREMKMMNGLLDMKDEVIRDLKDKKQKLVDLALRQKKQEQDIFNKEIDKLNKANDELKAEIAASRSHAKARRNRKYKAVGGGLAGSVVAASGAKLFIMAGAKAAGATAAKGLAGEAALAASTKAAAVYTASIGLGPIVWTALAGIAAVGGIVYLATKEDD